MKKLVSVKDEIIATLKEIIAVKEATISLQKDIIENYKKALQEVVNNGK